MPCQRGCGLFGILFYMKTEYETFLETKRKTFLESGFEVEESELNSSLFDFQKFTVKTALAKGRFAIFADCGLGKTLMLLIINRLWKKRNQYFNYFSHANTN